MKAVMFDFNMKRIILRKLHLGSKNIMIKYREDWPIPEIQFPNQVIAQPILGGICTSDLHQIYLNTSYYVSIMANKTNPLTLGHELVAKITKIGDNVKTLVPGDRVIYNPIPHCAAYGFQLCPSCQNGNYQYCYCLVGQGDGSELEKLYNSKGGFGGFLAGGFSEFFCAFEKQFYKVPSNIPSNVAVLSEPYAVALHAVARNPPKDSDTVLVIGLGIIGLLTIAAIRSLKYKCKIIAIARYHFQAEWAKKLGADEIIIERDSKILFQKIADTTQARLYQPILSKKVTFGQLGADVIYDCVNSEASLDDDIRLIRSGGRLIQVGLGYTYTKKIDWSIPIYKELEIIGTMMHGVQTINGKKIDSFELALNFFAEDPQKYNGLVTHTFPIDQYKTAFEYVHNKSKHKAIKVAFEFLTEKLNAQ